MIFSPDLCELILAGKKTVTRRPAKPRPWPDFFAPCRYRIGREYAIQPGRGKAAVGKLRIVDARLERLGEIDTTEAIKEGFGGRGGFVVKWTGLYGGFDPEQRVWRIAFELVPEEGA